MKLIFLIVLSFTSLIAYSYDVTSGALQNAPELRGYGYNQKDIYYQNNHQNYRGNSYNSNPNSTVPVKYGALAISEKTGYLAGAGNLDSLKKAKNEAIKQCKKGSKNTPCKVIAHVGNGCMAIATGFLNNKPFIFSAAGQINQSESIAMNECKKNGALECKITLHEVCSL